MTINPVNEGGAADFESVSTDEINGTAKPFNLLRQAGYEEGDFIALITGDTGQDGGIPGLGSDTGEVITEFRNPLTGEVGDR